LRRVVIGMSDTDTGLGKVVVNRAMSLDGFIAGPDNAMDWVIEYTKEDPFASCGSDLFDRRDVRWSSIAGPRGPRLPGSSSGCHNCCVEPNGDILLAK